MSDPIQQHIEAVCTDAGLGVMVQVYEVIVDREETPARAILALDAAAVTEHYFNIVGPAVDGVEAALKSED